MPDRPADPEPSPDPRPEQATESPAPPDRRTFLRQLSSDAVWTAGRVAGASAAFRRSLVAAGETAIGAFETATDAPAVAPEPGGALPSPGPAPAAADATAPATAHATADATSPASVAPRPVPQADPVAALTADQQTFLSSGRRAALAVNDPAGHPLLAFSDYHWDGSLFRLPARDFTARTIDIDRDPKVGLLIDDPASETWVAISGLATLVYGDQVEPEFRLILSKYHDADRVTQRWNERASSGDQVVIRIKPTRFVWRTR
jgi:hypothetical protein